ncbi:MAG TPA: class I adenylate-forming enzyme family protein [Thermoanaerobaculia bacterium]|jgi:acyl-CoA synthetase (AMP-forming)/AMP-acid ligase II|nr:class I adenylate-forming enzyme family protein [Thermoanaerobaculia bacterium]
MSAILEAFQRLARDRRGEPALWSRGEGVRLTFDDLATRVCAWERPLGPLAPLPVALATGNCAAFVELFLALRRRGLPVVAMDGALPLPARLELCRRLGVSALLHREPGAGEELGGGVWLARLPGVAAVEAPPGTVLVKLTSGSTGDPLGVCLGEEALIAGITHIVEGMAIQPRDRVLLAIPLSHSYGFDNGVLSLAVHGTPLVLEPSFYPGPLLNALAEGEITFFPTVPPLVRALAETDWPTALPLRTLICAGATLPVETARRFRARSGRFIHQFYGSTETGGISFEAAPHEPDAEGSVGRPLPGVRVALCEGGVVTIDSAANFGGHLGRDCTLTHRMVATGDTGELDGSGRLRLTGRSADICNVGGRKIPAAALEEALRGATGVEELAVVGVDDPVRGDRIVAFLVARGRTVDLSALPSGLQPREVRLVETLPYTERGKLDRQALRELARSRA